MWRGLVKKPVNFFKHADRDPEEVVEFNTAGILMFLMYAINGLGYLQAVSSPNERVFFIWLLVNKPTFIREESRGLLREKIDAGEIDALKRLSKKDFFETLTETIRKLG